jgi:hypothetical protein
VFVVVNLQINLATTTTTTTTTTLRPPTTIPTRSLPVVTPLGKLLSRATKGTRPMQAGNPFKDATSTTTPVVSASEPVVFPILPVPYFQGPVGGRLQQFWENWEVLGVEPYIVNMLKHGYIPEFTTLPPLTRVPPRYTGSRDLQRELLLKEMVDQLLQKQVIEEVRETASPGYYSRFFLVPKSTPGKWRAILDLSQLNREYLKKMTFSMETTQTIRDLLQIGDWAVSIDLKDACFHMPVHQKSRKYLRFVFQGKIFQFRSLVMGLSTAPGIFSGPKRILLQHLIRLRQYLDDWIIHDQNLERLIKYIKHVLDLLEQLGFIISLEKSELDPV